MSSNTQMYPQWRTLLFRVGVISCVLAAIGTIVCWANPFPLIPWGEGGYQTNSRDEYVFLGSVSTSLLTVILSSFGRGGSRILLILIGLVLLALCVVGFFNNHA